jgi:hypothetical protein
MSEEPRKSRNGTKTQLALAVAQGVRIASWARTNGVPRRTAFGWAKEPDVREAVGAFRRRTVDQAFGRMAKHTTRAVGALLADGSALYLTIQCTAECAERSQFGKNRFETQGQELVEV